MPIKPGRTRCRDLCLLVEDRNDGQCAAALPARVIKLRISTIDPGALSSAASRSSSLMWMVRPSTPSTTA
ncbi:hypothetical protein CQ10_29910 [Bradyrhizobium valentinum]|nr:hypothetical protein CQ10_29910 [Bradyrhizobium valentinum]